MKSLVLAAALVLAQGPGETFKECGPCPEMVVIPAGAFMMGSPASEEWRGGDEGPRHRVAIPRAFALGRFEVTFAEWDACVAGGGCDAYRPPDRGWGRGNRPVVNVDRDGAKAYARWLSRQTGADYRLPSEAEWEYAARAGTTAARYWGAAIGLDRANCDGCGGPWNGGRTAPVGSFDANAFGLHDMLGNVWEWVEGCWSARYGAPAGETCGTRVVRGASWFNEPSIVRAANRLALDPRFRSSNVGFRIARTLTE